MPKYRLVIFDFDGTLADSFALFLEAWRAGAQRYGFKSVTDHDIERLRGCSAREIIAEIGLPWWKLPFVARHMRQFMRERTQHVGLFDGIAQMLRKLKSEGVQLAIVTSNSRENVERVLGDENLALIDHFACGAAIFGKAPRIRAVMKAAGVASGQVLCVGDEIRDAQAAMDSGVDFAAVSWGYTSRARLEQLPRVRMCGSPLDILSLVIG